MLWQKKPLVEGQKFLCHKARGRVRSAAPFVALVGPLKGDYRMDPRLLLERSEGRKRLLERFACITFGQVEVHSSWSRQ